MSPTIEKEAVSSNMTIMAAAPGSFNQETVLFAQTSIAFPVEQGKKYRVEARKDDKIPHLSSFQHGWSYEKANGLYIGPEGATHYRSDALCRRAPVGMLIGGFVPIIAEPSLKVLDLVDAANHGSSSEQVLTTVLSGLQPVSNSWESTAPMKGFLVLLMNDAINSYSNNDGAIVIKVSPADR